MRETANKMCGKTLLSVAMATNPYIERLTDRLLTELLSGLPAVLVAGPRATGKTTTARRHTATNLRLDRDVEASAVAADPDVVLAGLAEPVLLDEWQAVPEVLGAVKRAVDDDPRPGRFVLTGSASSDVLADGWPATGRIVRITQWGLSCRELYGDVGAQSILDVVFGGGVADLIVPNPAPDLRIYVNHALAGGFPQAVLQPSEMLRRRWLGGYVDQLLSRDARLIGESRDPRRLRRYLQALATNSAGLVETKVLYDAAGISRTTALSYDALLELLMVTEQIPAFSDNRMKRLTRASKRFLVDPSMFVPLLGVNERSALRDGNVLGRLIETFVLAQLRPEREVSEIGPTFFHLREESGRREIDLIAEAPDGRLIGIEVKATAAPGRGDAKHLIWLRDQMGDRFVAGIVFHTGPRPFRIDAGIYALPISVLWGPADQAEASRMIG